MIELDLCRSSFPSVSGIHILNLWSKYIFENCLQLDEYFSVTVTKINIPCYILQEYCPSARDTIISLNMTWIWLCLFFRIILLESIFFWLKIYSAVCYLQKSWILLSSLNVSKINSIRESQICEERCFLKIFASGALVVKRQALSNLESNQRGVELSPGQHWRALWQ